jgi:hypothetical protein
VSAQRKLGAIFGADAGYFAPATGDGQDGMSRKHPWSLARFAVDLAAEVARADEVIE